MTATVFSTRGRRWERQPEWIAKPSGIFVPSYFWSFRGARTLGGKLPVQADNYGGTQRFTSAGLAIDNASATLDENFPVSEASAVPLTIAGSFICRSTAATEAAVGIGDAASSLYGFVGQYTAGSISGCARLQGAGADGAIDGPSAVIGAQYNCAYISRSLTNHTFWCNGIAYTSSTNKNAFSNTYGNFTIGAVNRGGTRLFRSTADVLQAWFHVGSDPGDEWLRAWSLNPNLIFERLPRVLMFGGTSGGGANPALYYAQMRQLAS
jgi:hypothetical protein